jgi:hypothetical protein
MLEQLRILQAGGEIVVAIVENRPKASIPPRITVPLSAVWASVKIWRVS